jgi:hypothetical protein
MSNHPGRNEGRGDHADRRRQRGDKRGAHVRDREGMSGARNDSRHRPAGEWRFDEHHWNKYRVNPRDQRWHLDEESE